MSAADIPDSAFANLGLSSSTIEILKSPPKSPPTAAAPNVLYAEPMPARALSPNESAITLYTEVLLHIRTVTLFASLRTNKNHTTRATLSTDGYTISVSHEGSTASIRLPIKAKGGRSDATLDLPASPDCKELSLRLQIAEEPGSDLFSGFRSEERKANIVPWDGANLNDMKGAKAACKQCGEVVVPAGKVSEWRDLPSENWAEMMDFWHCHKPDEHHLHDHETEETVARKGYAAGSKLSAVAGVGFVDLDNILLKDQDCPEVQVGLSFLFPYQVGFWRCIDFGKLSSKWPGAKKNVARSFSSSANDTSIQDKRHPAQTLAVRILVLSVLWTGSGLMDRRCWGRSPRSHTLFPETFGND